MTSTRDVLKSRGCVSTGRVLLMEEQQLQHLLDITFSKIYEEIDKVTYDCENVLSKLCESGLISEKTRRNIGEQKEAFEKNRYSSECS